MIFNSTQLKPLRLIFMLYFIYIYILGVCYVVNYNYKRIQREICVEKSCKSISRNIEFEIELRKAKDDVNLNLQKYRY